MVTEVQAPPAKKGAAPAFAGGVLALGLFVLTALGGNHPSLDAAAFAFGASLYTGLLVWLLLRKDMVPGALMVILLALAYVPSTWDAISVGFARTELHATDVGLRYAMFGFLGQMLLTAIGSWIGTKIPVIASLVHPDQPILHPEKDERSFIAGFILFLFACLVASILDGEWTAYAPGDRQAIPLSTPGGFRLSLLYGGCLLGASSLCGLKLLKLRETPNRAPWLGLTAVTVVLLFIYQARRFMLAALAMIVLPQLTAAASKKSEVHVWRGLAALTGAAAMVGVLFYGSHVWRVALHQRSEDTLEHLKGMIETQVGAEETIDNIRDRLNYLWMDAVALELGTRTSSPDLLIQSFMSGVASSVPGMLYPEKYKWEAVSCESLFTFRGRLGDLPCTALGDGILLGGLMGIFWVSVCWTLAVAVAESFYAAGTASGAVLSASMLGVLTVIETSAFPIIWGLRSLVLFSSFLAPLAWFYHSVVSIWRKTHPDVISGLDAHERAKRRASWRAAFDPSGESPKSSQPPSPPNWPN